ncbi:hypothetical protein THAOC_22716, partial [Thalassiosira oceanica]
MAGTAAQPKAATGRVTPSRAAPRSIPRKWEDPAGASQPAGLRPTTRPTPRPRRPATSSRASPAAAPPGVWTCRGPRGTGNSAMQQVQVLRRAPPVVPSGKKAGLVLFEPDSGVESGPAKVDRKAFGRGGSDEVAGAWCTWRAVRSGRWALGSAQVDVDGSGRRGTADDEELSRSPRAVLRRARRRKLWGGQASAWGGRARGKLKDGAPD